MHFLWSWNTHDLFLIEMNFFPPQAKQNLTALHPLSESCWDSQTSLHDDESTDTTPGEDLFRSYPASSLMCHMAHPVLARLRVLERSRPGDGKTFSALCSVSRSRLSLPAACCHAPVAPDCLIGTFQVREPDKPGQSAQTVIHLFSSRRCSCPFFCALPEVLDIIEEQE